MDALSSKDSSLLPSEALPSAPPRQTAPRHYFFVIQVLAVSAYVCISFVLPRYVSWLSLATHIAAVHVLLFAVVMSCWIALRTINWATLPSFFPLTPRLAETPALTVIVANALLLVCLGVEEWVQSEINNEFSILQLVQAIGVVELAIILCAALICAYRFVQYAKLRDGVVDTPRHGTFSLQEGGGGWLPLIMPTGGTPASRERIAELEKAETLAMRVLIETTANLVATSPDAHTRAVHDLASSLNAASFQCREARIEADARAAALEERVQYDESELRRATADVARLRAALKEEKKRSEKLFSTLDLEREASAQAQTVISDLRSRMHDGPSLGAHSRSGSMGPSSFSEAGMLARTASLAGRASFAAMASPGGLNRPSSSGGINSY